MANDGANFHLSEVHFSLKCLLRSLAHILLPAPGLSLSDLEPICITGIQFLSGEELEGFLPCGVGYLFTLLVISFALMKTF